MSGSRKAPLRTFLALWPDVDMRAALAERALAAARMCGGRAPRPDTLHLTLVFIGATAPDRIDALQQLMDATVTPAFTLCFERSGWWRHNGVAWLGTQTSPPALINLQDALARGVSRLGFSLDVRPYVPHLTLARDARRAPSAATVAPLEWRVDAFVLVASDLTPDGPRYRILHKTPLRTVESRMAPASPLHAGGADESRPAKQLIEVEPENQ
ncbi:MAG: RNA 2',3'-cyclic phosphodiesterase [Casimicrobiaceae bacterium]